MTDPQSLSDVLKQYALALDTLGKVDQSDRPTLQRATLTVLAQRDAVQVSLEEASFVAAEVMLQLQELDRQLRQQQREIVRNIQLEEWRSLLHPPESAWWWHLEPPALFPFLEKRYRWMDRLDWLWTFASLFFLTLAFTVVLDTLNRVVGEGLNTQGMLPVVVQVLLTIAGGSAALTEGGRNMLKMIMQRLRIPRHFWQEFSMVASLIVLLLVGGIHEFYLPQLAAARFQAGIEAYREGQFDSALQAYQQSLALQPDLLTAHYNLGLIYEDLQRTDEAIAEYQLVVRQNPEALDKLTWLRAHNNLGRLYILQENYRAAWTPLERALRTITQEDLTNSDMMTESYNLQKNIGWMWLGQGRLIEADEILTQAIAQFPQRAAAYCLKAQVLEGLEQPEAAIAAWTSCLIGERKIQAEEAEWAAMARERLESGVP